MSGKGKHNAIISQYTEYKYKSVDKENCVQHPNISLHKMHSISHTNISLLFSFEHNCSDFGYALNCFEHCFSGQTPKQRFLNLNYGMILF